MLLQLIYSLHGDYISLHYKTIKYSFLCKQIVVLNFEVVIGGSPNPKFLNYFSLKTKEIFNSCLPWMCAMLLLFSQLPFNAISISFIAE